MNEPITAEMLTALGWKPGSVTLKGKKQAMPVLWSRAFSPAHPQYRLCWYTGEFHNGARLELWGNPGGTCIISFPGCKTIAQIHALIEMLAHP